MGSVLYIGTESKEHSSEPCKGIKSNGCGKDGLSIVFAFARLENHHPYKFSE